MPKVLEKLLPMAPMLKQIAISGNTGMGGKCEIPLATITEFTELTFLGIAAMDLSGEWCFEFRTHCARITLIEDALHLTAGRS